MDTRILYPATLLITAAAALLLAGGTLGFDAPTLASGDEDHATHPPIVIVEDEGPTGFERDGEFRPGSGVVTGSGTSEDPYVIEGWKTPFIRIEGTDAHVTIQDNRVQGFNVMAAGAHASVPSVDLQEAHNVTVEGNTLGTLGEGWVRASDANHVTINDNRIVDGRTGVSVGGTQNAHIVGNTVTAVDGILVNEAKDTVVEENTVEQGVHGIVVFDSPGTLVTENRVEDMGIRGIFLLNTPSPQIHDNEIKDAWEAIHSVASPSVHVAGNDIQEASNHAIGIFGESDHTVEANTIEHADTGLVMDGDRVRLEANKIHAERPIVAWGPSAITILDNRLEALTSDATLIEITDGSDANIEQNTLNQGDPAILLDNVDDVSVYRNQVHNPLLGVHATDSEDITVRENLVQAPQTGLRFDEGSKATLHGNHLTDIADAGVHLNGIQDALLTSQTITGPGHALILEAGNQQPTGTHAENNRFHTDAAALHFAEDTTNLTVDARCNHWDSTQDIDDRIKDDGTDNHVHWDPHTEDDACPALPQAGINAPDVTTQGEPFTLHDDSSEGEAPLTEHHWTLGDDATATGDTITHTFHEPGEHLIVLRVLDEDDRAATATHTVTVT